MSQKGKPMAMGTKSQTCGSVHKNNHKLKPLIDQETSLLGIQKNETDLTLYVTSLNWNIKLQSQFEKKVATFPYPL